MKRRLFALHAAPSALAVLCLGACSAKESATAAPAAKATPRDAYEMAARGTGFTVGVTMAAHPVYVFFDTTCPHCAQLWSSSKPLLGKLKIVWMPVGLLRQTSGPQGATILAARDPVAAMAQNEAALLDRHGGIAIDPAVGDEVLGKVKANTELFMKLGAESVPLIVFKNVRTGEPGLHAGAVDTAQLAAMVGV